MRRLSVVILASSVLVLAGEAKAALVAEYRFEESLWNGTVGEVKDSSGNGYHATAVQAGSGVRPGVVAGGKVCRGAQISHNTSKADISAIATPVAIPTTVGNAGTIMFWYNNSANTPNLTRVLFDATTTANRFFYLRRTTKRALSFTVTDSDNTNRTVATSNNVLPNTGWSHIAVSWNFNKPSQRLRIWVNGGQKSTSSFTTNAGVSSEIGTLYIGDNRSANSSNGVSAGNPGGTFATIDEFVLYNHEADSTLINQHMNQTRVCHYAISHAGTGPACQANNVTVAAHDAAHAPVTLTGKTITLSTSTGQGDWALVSGSGVFNNGTPNDGMATYTWNGESQAVFALSHPTAGGVNINVSDGAVTEDATEDPLLNLTACFAKFSACHNYTTSHCSAATGRLYTRLAGVGSDYDIVALDGSDNVDTSFNGKAQVLLIARANPGHGRCAELLLPRLHAGAR
jgi:MSHA biogenesis protein MshQ